MILSTLLTIFTAQDAQLRAAYVNANKGAVQMQRGFRAGELAGVAMADKLISSFTGLGDVFLGAFAAQKVLAAFKEQAQHMREITLEAAKFRIAATDLDAFQQATVAMGGSAQEGTALFEKLATSQRDLATTGVSELLPTFRLLGIAMFEADGALKSVSDMLPEIADRIGKLTPQRQQLLAQKLGITQQQLELLRKGRTYVKDYLDEIKRTGPSKEQIAAGNALSLSLSRLKQTWEALTTQLLSGLTPAFQFVVDVLRGLGQAFLEVAVFIRDHQSFVAALAVTLGVLLRGAIVSVTTALWGFAAAMLANPAVWLAAGIAALAVGIALLVDDLYNWVAGNDSLIGQLGSFEGFLQFFKNLKKWGGDAIDWVINKFRELGDIALSIIDAVGGFFSTVGGLFAEQADAENGGRGGLATAPAKQAQKKPIPAALEPFNGAVGKLGQVASVPYNNTSSSAINRSSTTNNKTQQTNVNVAAVTIQTAATDASGIAADVTKQIDKQVRFAIMQMDDGRAL